MRRLAVLLIALVVGMGLAGGRAACRFTYGPPSWWSCFTELSILSLGPAEVVGGIELRSWPASLSTTPYLGLIWNGNPWFVFQLGRDLPTGWTFAISGGMSW